MLKLLELFFPWGFPGRPARRTGESATAVAELGAQVALPAGLAARLRAIPDAALDCTAVERLYAATLRSARGGAADPAVGRHMASCASCRATYGSLAAVFELPPAPLPVRLRFRLAALRRAQPRALPVWIADLRFAAAVCVLSTVLVVSALGSPGALVELVGSWGRHAATWHEAGERGGLNAWTRVAGGLATALADGKERFTSYGRLWGRLFDDSARVFFPQNLDDQLDRYFSSQGDDHGKPSTHV